MAEVSKAEAERQAAKNGNYQERDSYTAKQVAMRCGSDAKTMRKFFRSSHSTIEPVGQGGRYEFEAADLPKIKKEFIAWQNRGNKAPTPTESAPEPTKKRTKTKRDDVTLKGENVECQNCGRKFTSKLDFAMHPCFADAELDDPWAMQGDDDQEPSAEELAALEEPWQEL